MANLKQIKVGDTTYNIEPYTNYLPLAGGKMTGDIQMTENSSGIITRSASEAWYAGIYSNSNGDEVLGILVKNPRTHIMLGLGDPVAKPAATSLTPAIDIKNGKVGINKRLGTDGQEDAGSYELDVNGTIHASGTVDANSARISNGLYVGTSITHQTGDGVDLLIGNSSNDNYVEFVEDIKIGDFIIDTSGKMSGITKISIGNGANASATGSIAIGGSSKASANYSTALGYSADAVGTGTVSIGYNATGSGIYGVAVGYSSSATATGAVGIGYSAGATATGAIGIGYSPTSSGYYSIAVGHSSKASATGAIALGYKAAATGANSIAIGNCARTSSERSIVIGVHDISTSPTIHYSSIGIGSVQPSYDDSYGDTWTPQPIYAGEGAVAIGSAYIDSEDDSYYYDCAEAKGIRSIAIGSGSTAYNYRSVAIGTESTASGSGSVAIGPKAYTYGGAAGVAVGSNTTASYLSVAIGYTAKAYSNSVAIGQAACAGLSSYPSSTTPASGAYCIAIGKGVTAGVSSSRSLIRIGLTANNTYFYSGTSASWSSGSDIRDKTNIQPIYGGIDLIKNIQPISFQYNYRNAYSDTASFLDYDVEEHKKETKADDELKFGFAAQEVANYFDRVYGDEKINNIVGHDYEVDADTGETADYYSIAEGGFIPFLFQAIKEQQDIIESLEERISILESQIKKEG